MAFSTLVFNLPNAAECAIISNVGRDRSGRGTRGSINTRPAAENIMEKYAYKLETHLHTIHNSHCAETSPEKVAEVYARKGYNGIICTNHFNTHDTQYLKKQYGALDDCDIMELYLRDYYELKKCAARVGIDVFCGAEISPDCTTYYKDEPPYREFLILCISPEALHNDGEKLLKTDEKGLFEWCNAHGALLVQAHPYREICTPGDPKYLHGVEVANLHPLHNSKNRKALRFCRQNGLIATGGSDFHFPLGIGGGMMLARAPKDEAELAEIIKSRDYEIISSKYCRRYIKP